MNGNHKKRNMKNNRYIKPYQSVSVILQIPFTYSKTENRYPLILGNGHLVSNSYFYFLIKVVTAITIFASNEANNATIRNFLSFCKEYIISVAMPIGLSIMVSSFLNNLFILLHQRT